MSDMPTRSDISFSFKTQKERTFRVRVIDRINVDDVFTHLVKRELFRLAGGEDPGALVDRNMKNFLIKERLV